LIDRAVGSNFTYNPSLFIYPPPPKITTSSNKIPDVVVTLRGIV